MNHLQCRIQRFESRRNTRVLYNVYNSIQLSLCLQRLIRIWSVEIALSLKMIEIQFFFLPVILVTSDWSPTSWWSALNSKFSFSLWPYVSFYIHMTKLMISSSSFSVIFFSSNVVQNLFLSRLENQTSASNVWIVIYAKKTNL